MAKNKSGKGDVIVIGKDDWKGKKKNKTAPGGKYRFRFNKKHTKIAPNAKGDGNLLLLVSELSAMHNGKKSEHKGTLVWDRIAPHVGWKIAQVLKAMGVKKPPKKMTMTMKIPTTMMTSRTMTMKTTMKMRTMKTTMTMTMTTRMTMTRMRSLASRPRRRARARRRARRSNALVA